MNHEDQLQLPTLQRLVAMFRSSMEALGKTPNEADLEQWAVLIHASMSGRGRSYHTVGHVYDVNGGADAIGSLAILFHDTVYCEVDGGLPRGLEPHLGDALLLDGDSVELGPFDPDEDVTGFRCGTCDNCARPAEFAVEAPPVDLFPRPPDSPLPPLPAPSPRLRKGQKVSVPEYGDGEVRAVEGDTVAIGFAGGEVRKFKREFVVPKRRPRTATGAGPA